jgi:hypothetical protein
MMTYAGISFVSEHREAECGPDDRARQVTANLMRPIKENQLWNLSGSDLMLCELESSRFCLCVQSLFNIANVWT